MDKGKIEAFSGSDEDSEKRYVGGMWQKAGTGLGPNTR